MNANPTINAVQYAPGFLKVSWNKDGGSGFSVRVADTTAGTFTDHPAVGFSLQMDVTLDPADGWTAAVACTDDGTAGPYSPAIPILTAAPAVTSVQNLLSSIVAAWSAQAGYDGDYAVTLQTQGQSSTSLTTGDLTATFELALPPTGDATSVSVQLKLAVGQATTVGPATLYQVITAVPAMVSVDYSSGANLVLAWTPPAGYAAFRAFLQSSAGDATAITAAAATCTFPGPLAGATFTASVAATSADFVSVGPPCSGYIAIISPPRMASIVNNGAGVCLTWSAVAGSTAYRAVLQVPGNSPVTADPTAATYTFPGPLGTPDSTCWVSGTAYGGVVLGPPSTVYTILVGRPLWSLAAYDAGLMDLSWTAVADAGVSGYLITVTGLTPSGYPVGNTTSGSISATLVPFTTYPTTVAATNGIVQGPPSPTLIPLTAPPLNPILGYTGTALRLSWLPSGENGVTGYAVDLLSDGVSGESASAPASPQTFATAFTSGVIFTARVRSSGPGTLGPWCGMATGPYQAEIAYAYDAWGRLASVAWAAGFTESYAFDGAGNLLTATYSATPAPAQRK